MNADRIALNAALEYAGKLEETIERMEKLARRTFDERDELQRRLNRIRNTACEDKEDSRPCCDMPAEADAPCDESDEKCHEPMPPLRDAYR